MARTANITVTLPDGSKATGSLNWPEAATAQISAVRGAPMQVGVNVKPEEYTKWFPRFSTAPAFTRVFWSPGKGLGPVNGPAITGLPRGTLPWVSHKDEVPVSEVGAYWSKLLAAVNPGLTSTGEPRKLPWTFRHEGEDYDRIRFTAYWRDLRMMWNDHPQQDRIELVNIHTLYPSRWKSGVNWRQWMLPGIAHIDGWDCYPPQNFASYEPPASIFGLPIAAAKEFGMPFCIPEWGSGLRGGDPGDRRAAWFGEGLAYLAANGCRYVGLWCSTEELGGQFVDYRPTDAATLAAWNTALARYKP